MPLFWVFYGTFLIQNNTIYFRGQKIWNAIIDDLLSKGLNHAEKVHLIDILVSIDLHRTRRKKRDEFEGTCFDKFEGTCFSICTHRTFYIRLSHIFRFKIMYQMQFHLRATLQFYTLSLELTSLKPSLKLLIVCYFCFKK